MVENYLIPVIPFHDQIITKGEGSYIYDNDKKKYLDLNSGQFCTIFGHANQELAERVFEISKTITHTGSAMVSEIMLKTAKRLNEISGELDARSILLSTGAEAVEFALRYAKHITKKDGLICFDKGYHGLTLGTQSVTYGGRFSRPLISGVFAVPIPSIETEKYCIDLVVNTIEQHAEVVAAVVMEPIVSVGGMLFPSKKYFDAVRKACTENDVLLVFDESQTCFGRTGSWFCYQELSVVPDIVICSKGLGMGYPVSAVMFNGKLSEKKITMTHYSSHQNDPFSAGIIDFGIDYILENGLLESNKEKGKMFLSKLQELCKKCDWYRNPRGHGMMLGLDLFIDGVEDYRPIYSSLYNQAAEMGIILQGTDGGRVLRFLPDYLLGEREMDFCIDVLKRVRL